jgi:hypothetical protein
MPKDYSKAKIYKIVCNTTGKTYYGSTTSPLSKRLGEHVRIFKYRGMCSSGEIIKNENYQILLCEDFPCENVEQLRARERIWIEENDCVNLRIPNRTNREWYEENKEEHIERSKLYYVNHKKDIKISMKEYYEKHKEDILKKQKIKSKCPKCDKEMTAGSILRHLKMNCKYK